MGGKAQTLQAFIEKAQQVHGDKYDYSETEYVNFRTATAIRCKIHGIFNQKPKNHIHAGAGCQLCSGSGSRNTAQFIQLAKEIHGDVYDYSKVEYTNSKSKVKIVCNTHGEFLQVAHNHLNRAIKHGCPTCGQNGRNIPREVLLERFQSSHGTKYNYDKVKSGLAREKVTVTCPSHGDFDMTAHNHIYGHGCSGCATNGYRTTFPGSFYVLTHENITKVGITNRAVSTRIREINRSSGKKFIEHFSVHYEDGMTPYQIEDEVLKLLRDQYASIEQTYDGSTESFVDVDLPKLLQTISAIMTEKTENLPQRNEYV